MQYSDFYWSHTFVSVQYTCMLLIHVVLFQLEELLLAFTDTLSFKGDEGFYPVAPLKICAFLIFVVLCGIYKINY